jgi:fused signal recognition particle receptor
MSFLNKIFNKLKSSFGSNTDLNNKNTEVLERTLIDNEYLEKLEDELIRSDIGVKLSLDFIETINSVKKKKEIFTDEIPGLLKNFLLTTLVELGKNTKEEVFKLDIKNDELTAILVVGVNGVGKTTSIGKLAHRFKQEGHRVLIAAGDTFRAAAEEQLNLWANRAGVDLVQLEPGSKSSAVVYKAIEKAKSENYNLVIIDTAGRLQNKANLMEELSKIKQVIIKNLSDTKHHIETMLVLDASTGTNAISQAEHFNTATKLDSIILTKFDGTAKAGVVFSLARDFKLPVKFVGTGEKLEDISEFNLDEFIKKYF